MLYGVFHGDLHGGNLLVRHDGRVGLLDFGITGRLDETERLALLRLIMGGVGQRHGRAGGRTCATSARCPADVDIDRRDRRPGPGPAPDRPHHS